MALLVNYEGTYAPPQKLWYLVDGVWKEVINVFESSVQQDIAILDQNRIKQDQVVNALGSRAMELLAKVDGSDPTIPIETDPVKIEAILKEFEIVNLELEVAKTEQVVLTKYLFEQKAQIEYIKLVSEGEQALEKIAKMVYNPVEWQVIRIAPQSTLDERLEMAIQHGLETNDRIFNYGLVYYRLYKVSGSDQNDNIEYLKEQFKRRLNKVAFAAGIEPTNYIFTIDSVQNVYTEVNAFVNAGARRIEDFLASIKDQQKYILDKIESAKVAMAALEEKVVNGEITKVNGKIITSSDNANLQVPLGDVLLKYQNVTTFNELVSTATLQDIAAGIKQQADYPGVIKLNADANALNTKIQSIQNFQAVNAVIQNDLVSGKVTFNLNILTSKKVSLMPSKALFWSTPLGDSGIAGGIVSYGTSYTTAGTYRFKNNEMVTLSTIYTAIVNALSFGTNEITLGVTFAAGEQPKIVTVVNGNLYVYGNVEDEITLSSNQTSVVNVSSSPTSDSKLELSTSFNIHEQPHHSIVFVKGNASVTTESSLTLMVYHPTLNGLFYANTEDSKLAESTIVSTPVFEYAFNIRPIQNLNYVSQIESFSFNAKEIPLTDYFKNNDNIITQIKEEIAENTFNFNTKAISPADGMSYNDNIISQLSSEIVANSFAFNPARIISDGMKDQDNIIEQNKESLNVPIDVFNFNAFQMNAYTTQRNGLAQEAGYTVGSSYGGMVIIKPLATEIDPILNTVAGIKTSSGINKNLDYYQKTRVVIASQTGLAIYETSVEEDKLNKVIDSIPRAINPSNVKVYQPKTLLGDPINVTIVEIPRIATSTNNVVHTPSLVDNINYVADGISNISTITGIITSTTEGLIDSDRPKLLNKDVSSLVAPTTQINPGVVLN